MKEKTVELYGETDVSAANRKAGVWTAAAAVIGALTLGFCLYCAFHARAEDAVTWYKRAAAASILGGWAVITIRIFAINNFKAAKKHIEAVLDGERERIDGSFEKTGEKTIIKNGVTLEKIKVTGNDSVGFVSVYDKKASLFDDKKAASVYTVFGFITAYEVKDEDN